MHQNEAEKKMNQMSNKTLHRKFWENWKSERKVKVKKQVKKIEKMSRERETVNKAIKLLFDFIKKVANVE